MPCSFEFLAEFRNVGIHTFLEVNESFSDSTVQGNHRTGAVGLRADSTELEAIAGEGEGRRAVTVGIINQQFWNLRNVHLHSLLAVHAENVLFVGFLNMVEQLCELFAEERRDDCWGSLIGT